MGDDPGPEDGDLSRRLRRADRDRHRHSPAGDHGRGHRSPLPGRGFFGRGPGAGARRGADTAARPVPVRPGRRGVPYGDADQDPAAQASVPALAGAGAGTLRPEAHRRRADVHRGRRGEPGGLLWPVPAAVHRGSDGAGADLRVHVGAGRPDRAGVRGVRPGDAVPAGGGPEAEPAPEPGPPEGVRRPWRRLSGQRAGACDAEGVRSGEAARRAPGGARADAVPHDDEGARGRRPVRGGHGPGHLGGRGCRAGVGRDSRQRRADGAPDAAHHPDAGRGGVQAAAGACRALSPGHGVDGGRGGHIRAAGRPGGGPRPGEGRRRVRRRARAGGEVRGRRLRLRGRSQARAGERQLHAERGRGAGGGRPERRRQVDARLAAAALLRPSVRAASRWADTTSGTCRWTRSAGSSRS